METFGLILLAVVIGGIIGIVLGFIHHIIDFILDQRKFIKKEKRDARMIKHTGHI